MLASQIFPVMYTCTFCTLHTSIYQPILSKPWAHQSGVKVLYCSCLPKSVCHPLSTEGVNPKMRHKIVFSNHLTPLSYQNGMTLKFMCFTADQQVLLATWSTCGAATESYRHSFLPVSVTHDNPYSNFAPCEEKSGKRMVSCHRVNSLPSQLSVANLTLFSAQPALLQTFICSSYQVASCRSQRMQLLVREVRCAVVHVGESTGRYSSVNEVIGHPPLFQPFRLSLTRVALMLVKSSCSLEY